MRPSGITTMQRILKPSPSGGHRNGGSSEPPANLAVESCDLVRNADSRHEWHAVSHLPGQDGRSIVRSAIERGGVPGAETAEQLHSRQKILTAQPAILGGRSQPQRPARA